MFLGRAVALGALTALVGLAGCTEQADPPSAAPAVAEAGAGAAVPSYRPPSGAPEFCATLAGATNLADLPRALGVLAARPGDVAAGLQVNAAVGELQDAARGVRDTPGHEDLGAALDVLVTDLLAASRGELSDARIAVITTGLHDIGGRVQPVCRFPS